MFLDLDTPAKAGVFCLYFTLSTLYGLLNDNARSNGTSFNKFAMVFCQNCAKLLLAFGMYMLLDGDISSLIAEAKKSKLLMFRYMIPAGLYAAYDVLGYYNLSLIDSPTYFIVMQVRILVTALVHQHMFQKKLNKNNWVGLCLVMVGVVTQMYGKSAADTAQNSTPNWVFGSILVQVMLTATAGVINEKLLKDVEISMNLQNMYMYSCSMILLLVSNLLGLSGSSSTLDMEAFAGLTNPNILPMLLIMSTVGITTSVFLKLLDSIRKTIANAMEIVALAIFSCMLFDAEPTVFLAAASMMVAFGIYTYSKPVEESEAPPVSVAVDDIEMIKTS